jgi:propanol-preferring alcohol dehydrogenase
MKAQVLRAFRKAEEAPLRLEEAAVPVPGPEEVLVRVAVCGVCHTDLHTVEGDLTGLSLPRVPGHQVVGTVAAAGPLVRRFRTGDRVGVAWLNRSCGECAFCLSGRENLCEQALFTGFHRDGGYAEYALVPEGFAYHMPEAIDDVHAAPLLCAGIIGYRALKLSGVGGGARLGLFGFGASAHIALQVARHWDCRVFVFSRSPEHLRHALSLGAAWAGGPDDVPPDKLDAAIIFAPVGRLYVNALRVLDRGGSAVSAGIHMTPVPEFDYGLLYHERKMLSVANATRRDGVEFLKLAAEIPVTTTVRTFPLEGANEALRLLKAGRINGSAVLVVEPGSGNATTGG